MFGRQCRCDGYEGSEGRGQDRCMDGKDSCLPFSLIESPQVREKDGPTVLGEGKEKVARVEKVKGSVWETRGGDERKYGGRVKGSTCGIIGQGSEEVLKVV